MDARVVLATTAWTLAEMLRYAQKGALDPSAVREAVDSLTERKYPLVEEVDGRVYFHLRGISAREVALLNLWYRRPGRLSKAELIEAVKRQHFSAANAAMAVSRLGRLVDENENGLRLLQPGVREAETLLARHTREA